MSDLDTDRWQLLFALFERLCDLPQDAHEAVLAAEAGDDPQLREILRRMLVADASTVALDDGAAMLVDFDFDFGAGDAADAERAIGRSVGPWRLDRLLGRGGTGTVYAAHRGDPDSLQRAALKRLHRRWAGSPHALRFLQEHRILAALSHPNLPRLIDHGLDEDGLPWFALEYIDGRPLNEWADTQRLGLRERIDLFRQVCAAVQHAHEHFVVHRDLKPANILVDLEGHPKVLDFGVAKFTDARVAGTVTGSMAGFTPEYAAPEQVTGGAIAAATDVYALGVVLYELMSGRLPYAFDQQNLRETTEVIAVRQALPLDRAMATGTPADIQARLQARATDARAYQRFVRGDLMRIVQTALAKEPNRRYRSVKAFASDLQRLLQERTVSVSGDTFVYRARKFVRRNPWGVAMASLAVVALLGGSVALAWQTAQTRRESEIALQMTDYLIEMIRHSDLQASASAALARQSLDTAAARLRTLPADSEVRLQLLSVLLSLYSDRNLSQAGLRVALRELPMPPVWRDEPGIDGARLSATVHALRLRKELGEERAVRDRLEVILAGYPHGQDVPYAEAQVLIAEILGGEQRHRDCARVYRHALDIFGRTLPANDKRVLYTRVLLAGAITSQRRGREGRVHSERALADAGFEDSQVRAYVQTMAALRRALFGEFASAHELMLESRDMLQRLGYTRLRGYFVATRANNALSLGLPQAARADLDPQIEEERASPGVDNGADLADLLQLRGEAGLALGDPIAAARDFGEAAALLWHDEHPPPAAVYALALRAVALIEANRPDAAATVQARLDPLLRDRDRLPTYADAMAQAARGRLFSVHGKHREADLAFERAVQTLDAARARPADVHVQLKENRDRGRIRRWHAQALRDAGSVDAAIRLTASDPNAAMTAVATSVDRSEVRARPGER